MSINDLGLLKRWIDRRDASAFNELVARHAGLVFRVSKRVLKNDADAEDVAQDCFVKLASMKTPPPSSRLSLVSWLHTVATRGAIDALRSSRYRRARERRFAENDARRRATRQALDDLESQVDECVAALPDELKEVIVAHFFDQRSQREIAERLGVSRQAVTQRISKGVARVRKLLEKRGITASVAALTTLLGGLSLEAAPRALIATMGRVALAGSTGSATSISASASAAASASTTSFLLGGSVMASKLVTGGTVAAILVLIAVVSMRSILDDGPALDPAGANAPAVAVRDVDAAAGDAGVESDTVAGATTAVVAPPLEHTGMVIDASGTPVAGASVVIRSDAFPDKSGVRVTSGEDGLFRFVVPRGSSVDAYRVERVRLLAFRSGVGAGFGHRQLNAPSGLEITIDPLSEVSGRVYDAETGEGVPGLSLRLAPVDRTNQDARALHDEAASLFEEVQPHDQTVVTEEDGRFGFRGVLPARLVAGVGPQRAEPVSYRIAFVPIETVYLLPGSRGGGAAPEVALTPGEHVSDVEIALGLGGAIAGTVLGPDSSPLPGAEVRLITSFSGQGGQATTCDENGAYRFVGLPLDETYVTTAQYEGLAPGESRLVAMAMPELIEGVDVRLISGHTMQGRFVDDTGAPIAELAVDLLRHITSQKVRVDRAESDADGDFVFENVAEGSYTLGLDLPERQIKTAPHFLMPSDRDLLDREFVLLPVRDRPAFVSGRVVDPAGRPVPGVPVQAMWKSVLGRAVSADDGSFRIEGLPEHRSFTVTVAPGDYWSEGVGRVTVYTTDLVLVVDLHGRVQGRVVDAETGEPIQQFQVRVVWPRPTSTEFHEAFHRGHRDPEDWTWTTVKNASGEFSLDRVKSGERHVEVRAAGYSPVRTAPLALSSAVEIRGLRIALKPGAGESVSGVVVDAETWKPVPGVRVRGHQLERFYEIILDERKTRRPDQAVWQMRMTDQDGRFELTGLVPDDVFHIAAWKGGYGVGTLSNVSVKDTTDDLVIALHAAATIRLDCSFRPNTGKYFFYAHHREERPWDVAFATYRRLERSGVVELPALPAGPYRVAIYVRKTQPYGPMSLLGDLLMDLEAGETRELSLDLAEFAARFGSVRGVVRGVASPERTFLTIVSARDRDEHYTHRQWQCDADGNFHLTGLRAGDYIVRALNHSDHPPSSVERRVTVADRAHVTTEIVFE